MKLSDYIIDFLVTEGVCHVFELIGGAITHLLDSIYNRNDMHCVSVHHEQSAAFAAEAYARINGNIGVAMATSGPGALNLLTGIGSCYFDSVPCLFVTGQVNTYEYKYEKAVRQLGFQETDIVSVVKPLTKYAALVTDAETIKYHLEKAVYLARNGRPGPVLLDIPMNIQRAQIDPGKLIGYWDSDEYIRTQETDSYNTRDMEEVISLMERAKRPVILAGGGVRTAKATDEFSLLIEKTGIPVVTSLMGLDVVSHDNPAFFGMIGAYGNRYSNLSLANCDFLLILGSRLDTRQTGTRPETFARAAKKVHVDIDPVELNEKVKVDIALKGDVREFLSKINLMLDGYIKPDLSTWYEIIKGYRGKYPSQNRSTKAEKINPNRFTELLSLYCAEGDIICLDVGQHQMWAAQSFHIKKNQRMIISGGMGAMGFALPAALGAAKASPGRKVIVINGDGGIQVNIQELDTIVHHNLPVKIFAMNNRCLGMVRQFQDMFFGGRRQSTVKGYSCPDLGKVATAYGIPSYIISSLASAPDVIETALKTEGPAFVDVRLEQTTCVDPKLVVNRPIEDMSPLLEKTELEKIMLIDLVEEMEVPG
ncbi:thiamine pyrophosphate-binding protein [Pelotomaculum propionicicum]|uniref:Acetolactate synthase large subunit n=1 Tax=Pelotomaculum propionicicum TaxID=258475 RepID=A0A4Y7RWC6_9FIRM|nr:thiamine pyrophosphate-binding protein [Pelotomaculum propionicicum]NLI14054.1 thiamine pyrophosphate-binding protein [Peptococcaceae bacterium]TEB12577.1 Acetolactate synthase large subunit [Pelotomaculum propionicicum]